MGEIQGWFDSPKLYTRMVSKYPKGHFVEIGAWLGSSTRFMGELIKEGGNKITFDVVDHFHGNPEHDYQQKIVKLYKGSVYKQFERNMKKAKCWSSINKVHIMDSFEASKLYKKHTLDFVYIDASHTYEAVMGDLLSWYNNVKPGGTIGGDDYNSFPGVKAAVNDFFNSDQNKLSFSGAHTWEYLVDG